MFSEPTINQLSLVVSQAMAPAFLLVAVASFLSVLINHMGRIVDRSRMINAIPDEDIKKAHLKGRPAAAVEKLLVVYVPMAALLYPMFKFLPQIYD